MSFIASTSRLSYWTTTRPGMLARSSGAMSTSGARVMSMPPTWMPRWRGKPSMRAHSSSQRSQGERPTVLPPRGCGGGSGSTRATLEWLGARPPPRPIACVGGAGGSQAYGRPRRSVRRSGGSRTPVSGSIARPSIVPAEVGGRMSVGGCPPARSQRTLAGESPGPPSSSEGLGRSVVTGARRSGESTSGSGTTDRPPTVRGRMSPMGNGPPCPPRRGPGPWIPGRGRARTCRSPCRRSVARSPCPTGRDARPPEPGPPGTSRAWASWPMPSTRPRSPATAAAASMPGGRAWPTVAHPLPGRLEELGEAAVRLEVAADHDRVVGLERLGHPIDERPREAQRVADLAHRRSRPIGDDVADHARVRLAVALVDVLDDLLAAARGEVDVDVRDRRSGPR